MEVGALCIIINGYKEDIGKPCRVTGHTYTTTVPINIVTFRDGGIGYSDDIDLMQVYPATVVPVKIGRSLR